MWIGRYRRNQRPPATSCPEQRQKRQKGEGDSLGTVCEEWCSAVPVPFGDEEWISKAAQEPPQAKDLKANTAPVAKARRRPNTTLKPSPPLPKPEAARQPQSPPYRSQPTRTKQQQQPGRNQNPAHGQPPRPDSVTYAEGKPRA